MTKEYIDKEAFKKFLDKKSETECQSCTDIECLACVEQWLSEQTAADVAEVVHGTPIIKHRHFGGFRQYTGIDAMGETHTIEVDERWECDARHCPKCQALLCSRFENYCSRCGAKMDGGADHG